MNDGEDLLESDFDGKLRASQPSQTARLTCPHLGLVTDQASCLLYSDTAHRCYAWGEGQRIGLGHQEEFCLGRRYGACARFVEPTAKKAPVAPAAVAAAALTDTPELGPPPPEALPQDFSSWRVALWAVGGAMVVLVTVFFGATIFSSKPEAATGLPVPTLIQASPLPAVTPLISELLEVTPTSLLFLQPTETPTPIPGGTNFSLSPSAGAVGWVVSGESRGNHFGDSNIYSGVYDGQIYHGALQFDLSAIPRGAPIQAGSLFLTGLDHDRLGPGGVWELRVLTETVDYQWPSLSYQDLHNAQVLQSVAPALGVSQLEPRQANIFNFSNEQLKLFEQRVLDEGRVSFRLDGPLEGRDSLFSWDSGYGPESTGQKPVLFLSVGVPPATPPPHEYVVVTNTPTPENVLTAAAFVARATIEATTTGTATPIPRNLATATPAEWVVVTNTPESGNKATAQFQRALATAIAMTTGTPTATPPNMVTATPSPTLVLVTSVPTPENALTAAAQLLAMATAQNGQGTPTPLPPNWVTPIVITPTPEPGNPATARAVNALATANAVTTGTPTPLPPNVVTATPTPTLVVVTSVPMPDNALTAVAWAQATATAQGSLGFPTALPPNWVTPVVVTATPLPENGATAVAVAAQATADALTFGTPTPLPPNVVMATATPWIATDAIVHPTPTPLATLVPTPNPHTIPSYLLGRIGFMSDRDGGEPWYYVMDADGGNVQRLTGPDAYNAALIRDTLDPGGQYQAIVTKPRSQPADGGENHDSGLGDNYEISLRRLSDGQEQFLTGGTKGADYDPAYCQADPRYIAFTSQQTSGDEIFALDLLSSEGSDSPLRTVRLTENEWPWDKHPSWAADCQLITFASNRTGNNQIWIMEFWGMDFPGENQHNISNNAYNDWAPVWFKAPPSSSQ